ncbi:MAG: TonB-dependent receptor [Acidobacteriota bacterium]
MRSRRGSTANRLRLLVGLAPLAILLVFGATSAWAQLHTATVEASAEDNDKLPIPGVTVVLNSKETGLQRTATTDISGSVTISAVPPGTYDLSFELSGFQTVVEEGVTLRVGQTARVVAKMQQAGVAEQVTVTADVPLVDVYKTDASTNILPEQIESLPVADRDFQRLAFIAPGVERERGEFRFISGGPVLGSGGNASQSTILVDGVDLTDQALGLSRTRFSQDAIREFRVITNRFDAEVGGSAGGALSIVTKSGTNELSGSVFGFYRADELRSKGELEQESLPFSRGQFGFTLGGPIVKDRTHFFASAEYIDENNIALFRPGGAFTPLGRDIEHPFNQTLTYFGLDHQFSSTQRASAKFVYEHYNEKNFRVGGVKDESNGQELIRDNWNLTFEHVWVPSSSYLNELRFQVGHRKYDEPTNSDRVEEWFSSGTTLRTGTNVVGDLLGDGNLFEILDTIHFYRDRHDLKAGVSIAHINEISRIDVYQNGLFLYLTDTRAVPLAYVYGIGSSEVEKPTTLFGTFFQDDWHIKPNLTLSLGLRYDLDTGGNNPDFTHPLVPDGRKRDKNNIQPRVGFSWDIRADGSQVVRGGYGRYAGRYLLVPAFTELQQNGVTGRRIFTRVNIPPYFILDPNNPTTTGYLLKPQITLLDNTFDAPEADQFSLGWTAKLGDTGLYFDTEAVYVKGEKEIVIRDKNWSGNATHTRPNTSYDQINTYTNDGHSSYKAVTFSMNGAVARKHTITGFLTVADKKNISDDFSPEFPYGYPSDPADMEAEYGRARSDERWHFVATAILQLPWTITVAPIAEYGSGMPWNPRLGYDYNGDGKNSDRAPGVKRNSEDGPSFKQFSLRVTKAVSFGDRARIDVIVEGFNLFNNVNYDVNSVDSAMYLRGPTITNPTIAYVPNPNFGNYSATLRAREIQLGFKLTF